MGLDMFLFRRDRGDGDWEHWTEVAYWRKANAIHRWFVMHVQDGVDDCQAYPVSAAQLGELYATVEDVLAHEGDPAYAAQHLPTQDGFFFGSTNYDADYWDSLRDTLNFLYSVLDTTDFATQEIVYRSSW